MSLNIDLVCVLIFSFALDSWFSLIGSQFPQHNPLKKKNYQIALENGTNNNHSAARSAKLPINQDFVSNNREGGKHCPVFDASKLMIGEMTGNTCIFGNTKLQ